MLFQAIIAVASICDCPNMTANPDQVKKKSICCTHHSTVLQIVSQLQVQIDVDNENRPTTSTDQ